MPVQKVSCLLSEHEFKTLYANLGRNTLSRLLGVSPARVQQIKRNYGMTDPSKGVGQFKRKFDTPKEELAEMYIGEKMSVEQIAGTLGCSKWTVIKNLKKHGLYKGGTGYLKESRTLKEELKGAKERKVVIAQPEKPEGEKTTSEVPPNVSEEEYDIPVDEKEPLEEEPKAEEKVVTEAPKVEVAPREPKGETKKEKETKPSDLDEMFQKVKEEVNKATEVDDDETDGGEAEHGDGPTDSAGKDVRSGKGKGD